MKYFTGLQKKTPGMLVVSSHESDQMFQITEITKRNLQKKDIIATFLARFLIIFFYYTI